MDGHTNTEAWLRNCTTSGLVSVCWIQTTLPRSACTRATREAISSAISGVSGAPAHSTSWAAGSIAAAASSRWASPFWRVMRPTNTTVGAAGSTPWRSRTSVPGSGRYSSASMPL